VALDDAAVAANALPLLSLPLPSTLQAALDKVKELGRTPRLATGDYNELCAALRKILAKDSIIPCAAAAAEAAAVLASGLREAFSSHAWVGGWVGGWAQLFACRRICLPACACLWEEFLVVGGRQAASCTCLGSLHSTPHSSLLHAPHLPLHTQHTHPSHPPTPSPHAPACRTCAPRCWSGSRRRTL
jgi:hypothetical protein